MAGDVGPDGTYKLKTVKGKRIVSGAPEGEYAVTITLPIPQGEHKATPQLTLSKTVRVEAKDNTIDLKGGT